MRTQTLTGANQTVFGRGRQPPPMLESRIFNPEFVEEEDEEDEENTSVSTTKEEDPRDKAILKLREDFEEIFACNLGHRFLAESRKRAIIESFGKIMGQ